MRLARIVGMKIRLVAVIAFIALSGLALHFWLSPSGIATQIETETQATANAGALPVEAPALDTTAVTRRIERTLVAVIASRGKPVAARILHAGRVAQYRLGDAVAPDASTLAELQERYVELEKDGVRERLDLAVLNEEEKFLYSDSDPAQTQDVVTDQLPETPEGKRALALWGNPHAECDKLDNERHADDCRQRVDEQIEAASEACEALAYEKEVYRACLYKAHGVPGTPTQINTFIVEQRRLRAERKLAKQSAP